MFKVGSSIFSKIDEHLISDWSDQIYKIKSIERSKNQICYYRIKPLVGEDQTLNNRFFYGQELNLITRIR